MTAPLLRAALTLRELSAIGGRPHAVTCSTPRSRSNQAERNVRLDTASRPCRVRSTTGAGGHPSDTSRSSFWAKVVSPRTNRAPLQKPSRTPAWPRHHPGDRRVLRTSPFDLLVGGRAGPFDAIALDASRPSAQSPTPPPVHRLLRQPDGSKGLSPSQVSAAHADQPSREPPCTGPNRLLDRHGRALDPPSHLEQHDRGRARISETREDRSQTRRVPGPSTAGLSEPLRPSLFSGSSGRSATEYATCLGGLKLHDSPASSPSVADPSALDKLHVLLRHRPTQYSTASRGGVRTHHFRRPESAVVAQSAKKAVDTVPSISLCMETGNQRS